MNPHSDNIAELKQAFTETINRSMKLRKGIHLQSCLKNLGIFLTEIRSLP